MRSPPAGSTWSTAARPSPRSSERRVPVAGLDPRDAVVVVTGASSGIGWSTAWAFAARGAVVVPTARRLERLENLAFEIRARGGTATPVACDVADRDSIHALAEAVRDLHGRCDVLVTNVNPGLVSTERFPHRDAGEGGGIRSRLVMRPERIAREIVRVVERGIAPERSVPRWLAAPQAARLLAPPLFRGAVRRVAAGVVRTTRVDEAVAPIRASVTVRSPI